jgi:2,3-bisphosphoglycerate-dependent phosphoglycerate mutase
VQTVEPLAAALALGITLVDDLRERLLSPEPLPGWEDHCRASWADPSYALAGGVLDEVAARHSGERVAVSSHGNLIALALAAGDRAIGFDFWRAMPMPAVYRLDRE